MPLKICIRRNIRGSFQESTHRRDKGLDRPYLTQMIIRSSRSTMLHIMERVGAKYGFFIVGEDWKESMRELNWLEFIKGLERIADEWKVFGDVYVFKFEKKDYVYAQQDLISNCDEINGFSVGATDGKPQLTADEETKLGGVASLKVTYDISQSYSFWLTYGGSWDLSRCNAISLSVRVTDSQHLWRIYLKIQDIEGNCRFYTLIPYNGTSNRWLRVIIPLGKYDGGIYYKPADLSRICKISIS